MKDCNVTLEDVSALKNWTTLGQFCGENLGGESKCFLLQSKANPKAAILIENRKCSTAIRVTGPNFFVSAVCVCHSCTTSSWKAEEKRIQDAVEMANTHGIEVIYTRHRNGRYVLPLHEPSDCVGEEIGLGKSVKYHEWEIS
ncbi:MAG: hypothetical protein Q8L52_02525 [bacterium]|nr:hypothetical protein [bacterium]